jgi:membrane fusion protein (multidrug efflux system)
MTKRMLWMLLGVVLLVVGLGFGFFLHIQKMIASAPKPGPQTVTSIKVKSMDWQPQIKAVGSLLPVRGVDLASEVAGLVREVQFKSGDTVKKGAVLVQLNADSDAAQLQALEAAADLARVVYDRDKAQYDAKAISKAQLDTSTADLKAKKAQVAQQRALVEKKVIRAPFSGRLGITTVMPGQYINAGDKIVTLQKLDPIYVDFNLPEKMVSRLKEGQHVELSVDAYPDLGIKGQITAINPKVDTTTRNVLIEATLPNKSQQLLPGMFAQVRVNAGNKARYLTLPQTAITYNPYGATVFVLKPADKPGADGKTGLVANQVFVTTGETRGDQVAVIKGLEEGQEVVTTGQLKLKNGTPVVVDNKVQPANDAAPTPQER